MALLGDFVCTKYNYILPKLVAKKETGQYMLELMKQQKATKAAAAKASAATLKAAAQAEKIAKEKYHKQKEQIAQEKKEEAERETKAAKGKY